MENVQSNSGPVWIRRIYPEVYSSFLYLHSKLISGFRSPNGCLIFHRGQHHRCRKVARLLRVSLDFTSMWVCLTSQHKLPPSSKFACGCVASIISDSTLKYSSYRWKPRTRTQADADSQIFTTWTHYAFLESPGRLAKLMLISLGKFKKRPLGS
jgi:hypothetical protein